MKKIVISWFICVLGLVALFAWVGKDVFPGSSPNQAAVPSIVKAEFALQDGTGKTVTHKDFRGKYMLIFFGFTHCPDICPTSLLLVQNTLGKLGDAGKRVQSIFITTDPERDTPKVASDYAGHFGNTVGLSGTPEQIKAAADNFKVYYSKVPMSDPSMGYMINHSGFLYLVGPDGKFITHFAHDIPPTELESALRKHVR